MLHLIYNQKRSLCVFKILHIFRMNVDTVVPAFPGVLPTIMNIPFFVFCPSAY